MDDLTVLTGSGDQLRWLVLDCAAIGDVDVTAAAVLMLVAERLHARHIEFVVSSLLGPVRQQFARYAITGPAGPDAYYDTPGAALEAFRAI
jgi:anti-anti-sigma regulatory factor